MWWSEEDRQWKPHPDCTCGKGFSCVCHWLDPLDEKGQPIKGTMIEAVRDGLYDPDHLNPSKGGNKAGDDYW